VGINLIVLDDGWFGKRVDNTTSLGDWVPDLNKFPQGIEGLVKDVNAAGCKFGIYMAPELVSADSVGQPAAACLLVWCLTAALG
jgi:alpha-galactosidase